MSDPPYAEWLNLYSTDPPLQITLDDAGTSIYLQFRFCVNPWGITLQTTNKTTLNTSILLISAPSTRKNEL